MKILIADDEDLIRSTLKSMLFELEFSITSITEAANGEELVELAQQHHPDIAFVDIRMPKLDGLKAISILKELCPDTQWIILTGFSEFEYAHEAIKQGISNYLLKPVSPDELADILDTLLIKSKKRVIRLNKAFENDIIALFDDLVSLETLDSGNVIKSSCLMGGIFTIDSHLDEKCRALRQQNFCNLVYTLINEFVNHEIRLTLLVLPWGEMATIAAWGLNKKDKVRESVLKYFNKLESIVKQSSSADFPMTLIQSGICDSFDSLRKQMNQIQNLSPVRIIMESRWRIDIYDLVKQYKSSSSQAIELTSIILRLSQNYKDKVYLNYMKCVDEFERFVSVNNAFNYENIMTPLEKFLTCSIKCDIHECQDIKVIIKNIRKNGEILLEGEGYTGDVIDQVVNFIENNYMKDIGIAQIAKQLDITPNYLSSVFHKKAGETFMKHLTKVRMLKARELLTSPNAQVNHVAEQVGYYTSRHFTKLYKEFFGAYPSEHLK